MFGKKKQVPQIDKEQLELIQKCATPRQAKKTIVCAFCHFSHWCLVPYLDECWSGLW